VPTRVARKDLQRIGETLKRRHAAMSDKFEFGSWPLDEVDHDAIEEAIQDLARWGLIVDTGRRRWSERTRSYEIVWVASEFAHRDQQKKLN
jgi:hypothetical protein